MMSDPFLGENPLWVCFKLFGFLLLFPFGLTAVFSPFVYFYLKIKDMWNESAMYETQYRIYPDGSVYHEDEFAELDHSGTLSDDYKTVSVPDAVVDFIVDSFACSGAVPSYVQKGA
ncbi:MAG: hypothetical protein SD837_22030 [Candidatus Electrothrix scaldis]|nr:MAG: hypothetical protein SD837_22030 [Candidatus Electrothrix sp. GW3-3]